MYRLPGREEARPREKLQYRPSVYGVVIHEGRLLVLDGLHTDRFFLPGGGIQIGERLEAALQREVREETGIKVTVGPLLGFDESFFYYNALDEAYHALLFFYQCTPTTFTLISSDQVDDSEATNPHWVDLQGLRAEDFHGHGELILGMVAHSGRDGSGPPLSRP